MENINYKSGQVLLITIMLLATVLTVVISLSYKTTTETQIAKLEAENQKALAAAESSIESLIQEGGSTYTLSPQSGQFTGIVAQAQVQSSGTEYSSPSVQRDKQSTFYLVDYNSSTGSLGTNYYTGTLTVYYGDGTDNTKCDKIALELTFLSTSSPTVTRWTVDSNSVITHGNSPDNAQVSATKRADPPVDNVQYQCVTTAFTPPTDSKLMIARVLVPSSVAGSMSTKIGLKGNQTLRTQAKKVVSQATTATGVTKSIQLTQTLPQIPADFFVTSF